MDAGDRQATFEGRQRRRDSEPGRAATVVFGLVLIAIGAWFFADDTLGLDLPEIDWGALWPLAFIGLGAWMIAGAGARRR